MKDSSNPLLRAIRHTLSETSLDWRIVDGAKHRKLFINGRMVMTISAGTRGRDLGMLKSIIRKTQERMKAC